MIRVYKQKELKKNVKVWTIAFTPKKGTGERARDNEWGQCTNFVRTVKTDEDGEPLRDKKGNVIRNGGLCTGNNQLAENAWTQCPKCREIFDHTIPENNKFETVRRLV